MRDDRITMRFMSVPSDAAVGSARVAAGSVLEWIDKAAYACAVGWAGTDCVTAYVGNVHYTRAIAVGEVVAVHARIVHTGRSSMHILASVETSDPRQPSYRQAADCILVFVSVDEQGRGQQVPVWTASDGAELTLQSHTLERVEVRQHIKAAMAAQEYTDEGTTPRSVMRFLAPPSSANWAGKAHGGTVMRWIDEVAFACAAQWTSLGTVAAYSGGIHFHRPIQIGHLVELEARLIHTTVHGMHISIHVRSADPRTPGDLQLTTRCMSVFVDPGLDGRALPVRQLEVLSDEDRRLQAHAIELIRMRSQMRPIPADLAWRD